MSEDSIEILVKIDTRFYKGRLHPQQTNRAEDLPPDLSSIVWKPTAGPRGPFEIAESKTNAQVQAFTRLIQYLNNHQGRATVSGYFVWKFGDTSGSIGRKLAQR
jgi:hypothetical protein